GELAVMVAHSRAGAAASAVGKQRHISSRRQSMNFPMSGKQTELDEMIAAAAGAELRPGAILILAGYRADAPIGVQHFMLTAILEVGADTKTRFGLDRPSEAILMPL